MNDGGPAFPSGNPAYPEAGMTLRDWFAGQAMAAIVSDPEAQDITFGGVAEDAYRYADAMIQQREKPV